MKKLLAVLVAGLFTAGAFAQAPAAAPATTAPAAAPMTAQAAAPATKKVAKKKTHKKVAKKKTAEEPDRPEDVPERYQYLREIGERLTACG